MNTWLPIKEEYLIENFDNLLTFLAEADYNNPDDGFLRETIIKLEDVAYSILNNDFSHKLGYLDTQDANWIKNFKIVSTSIYASYRYNRDINHQLTLLLDTLIINQIFDDEDSFSKIKSLLIALANQRMVRNLTYNLRDLMADDFNTNLFAQKLLRISCNITNPEKLTYENKGTCIFNGEEITIIPTLTEKGKTDRLKTLLNVAPGIELKSDDKIKINEADFKDQVSMLNILLQTQSQIVRQPERRLKQYTDDDLFFVEVTDVRPDLGWVKCRTIDPAYESLELNLYIPQIFQINPSIAISRNKFIEHIYTGLHLRVSLFRKECNLFFSFLESLWDYYFDINDLGIQQAIFIREYSYGTRWITEMGKIVNIKRDPKDLEIAQAFNPENACAIEIKYNYVRTDSNGIEVINAERVGSIISDVDHYEFLVNMSDTVVTDFYEYTDSQCPPYPTVSVEIPKQLAPQYVTSLCHLLVCRGEDPALTHYERYINVIAAQSLAVMTDSEYDNIYCQYSITYLRALWAFAQDCGHEWLRPAVIPLQLISSQIVDHKQQIIKILSGYKEDNNYRLPEINGEINVIRLQRLVEGSNALLGNITNTEINRIKRSIAQYLGIESIYKEPTSDKFWFGEETEMLEFKKSIVFPPSSKGVMPIPNPNVQIWAILKTINGFLNSLHGGTLLIGVNDYGNADGVEPDIEWLYRNGLMLSNNVDRYIQYIKMRVDNAYEAYKRNDRGREITSTRVRYTSFITDGYSILRIDVLPYEMGCVRMVSDITLPNTFVIHRPAYIKDAYLRNTVTTEQLTDKMRQKLEADKRNVIKDSEKQKLITIQEAIDTNRMIRLNAYQSSTSEADRDIIPIELLPQRGLVVGQQRDTKTLRVYKLARCAGAEILPDTFRPVNRLTYTIDPFNMLVSSPQKPIKVNVRLKRPAWLMLQEMYPYTENYLTATKDPDYPYALQCEISDVRGIGAFCMSMLDHIDIIEGEPLRDFIRRQCATQVQKEA